MSKYWSKVSNTFPRQLGWNTSIHFEDIRLYWTTWNPYYYEVTLEHISFFPLIDSLNKLLTQSESQLSQFIVSWGILFEIIFLNFRFNKNTIS